MGLMLGNAERMPLKVALKEGVCPTCEKNLEECWIYNAGDWSKTEAIYYAHCCNNFFELFAETVIVHITKK